MSQTPAITGTAYTGCQSFKTATTTSASTETGIAAGSYALHASGAGVWVKTGDTGVTIAVPSTTQPAVNGLFYVAQDSWQILDVTEASQFIITITESGSGNLRIIGPLNNSSNR